MLAAREQRGEEHVEKNAEVADIIDLTAKRADRPARGDTPAEQLTRSLEQQRRDEPALRSADKGPAPTPRRFRARRDLGDVEAEARLALVDLVVVVFGAEVCGA
jgi:hypothetical protein